VRIESFDRGVDTLKTTRSQVGKSLIVLKLKGEGYKDIKGEIGDLYLKIIPI